MTFVRAFVILLLPFLLVATAIKGAANELLKPLRVSSNGRHLTANGQPCFLLCDTAWSLALRASREEAKAYLLKRRAQDFNAIAIVLFAPGKTELTDSDFNYYGHAPFKHVDGQPDPAQPIVVPGPGNDYWDHVDWILATSKELGLYVIVLPTWGSGVAGDYTGKPAAGQVFDERNAGVYARWLGLRYGDQPHVTWMIGGDREAVYSKLGHDYRSTFRAMATQLHSSAPEALLSYHPAKSGMQSGDWFHDDAWLSFNSIQLWPETQIAAVTRDWERWPVKPTWLFEGRYEAYRPEWGDWQIRQQAWQTVFAGGFGHTYGHQHVFDFGLQGADWNQALNATGANQLQHLVKLISLTSRGQADTRIPHQPLIDGEHGQAQRLTSNRLTAVRNEEHTLAMVYSASGNSIQVKLEELRPEKLQAYWFNPRNGYWNANGVESPIPTPFQVSLPAGGGKTVREFVPPSSGAGQDWVLVLCDALVTL